MIWILPNRPAELSAIRFTDNTRKQVPNKNLVGCALIDFIKAFDTLSNAKIQAMLPAHRINCSHEIRELIPVPLRLVRTTRSSTHSHALQVSLPTSRILSHKSLFIPTTCNLWSVLSSSCFPESYNFHLSNLRSIKFPFFFLPLLGLCIGHHGLSPT